MPPFIAALRASLRKREGESVIKTARCVLACVSLAAAVACGRAEKEEVAKIDSAKNDSVFVALQKRGEMSMGVDQMTSMHRFEALPDGGRIVLQADSAGTAAETTIRAH